MAEVRIWETRLQDYWYPRKTFTGGCLGIALDARDESDDDLHVMFKIIVEDDGEWFWQSGDVSSHWLPELHKCMADALIWLEVNAIKDEAGWKFPK
jgi:hypothetical protein